MLVKNLQESLPQRAYSATQVLENEMKISLSQGIKMYDLMENAGCSVFSYIQDYYPKLSNMLVLCGKGNNGGDGFIVARLAQEMGVNVTVYVCTKSERLMGDAKIAFNLLQKTKVTIIYHHECPKYLFFFTRQ